MNVDFLRAVRGQERRRDIQVSVRLCHIYGILGDMKEPSVRTTVDIPSSLYRRLKAQAAARGSSVRELVLTGVRVVLLNGQRPPARKVKFPLIRSNGPKVDLTNEQIYEHVEFP